MHKFTYRFALLVILLLMTSVVAAHDPEPGHTGPVPDQFEQLAFLEGDWLMSSSRNLTAFDPDSELDPEAALEDTTAVARIQKHLDGHALLASYTGLMDGTRIEGTIFMGVHDRPRGAWDMVWSQSGVNTIEVFTGNLEEDGTFLARWNANARRWKLEFTDIEADSFVWTVWASPGRTGDLIPVWTMDFTRIPDDAEQDYEVLVAELRDGTPFPEPSEGVRQFEFFIGDWDIVSRESRTNFEPLPGINHVTWINGGHGFMEHWVALWQDEPFEAMSMSLWNEDAGYFENVWWATRGRNASSFPGGKCQGQGEHYYCKLAGYFTNITADSVSWASNLASTPGWSMEFTRHEH